MRAWRHRFPMLLPTLLLALGTGCSVNGAGIGVRERYLANASGTGRAVKIEAWGVHASGVPGDEGVSIGHIERTYFLSGAASPGTPRSFDAHLLAADGVADALALREVPAFDWSTARPVATEGRAAGLALDANRRRVGLTLGVGAFAELRLPSDSNVLVFIRGGGNRNSSPTRLYVKEFQP